MKDEREACEDCPFYNAELEVCASMIGCLNEGVEEEVT